MATLTEEIARMADVDYTKHIAYIDTMVPILIEYAEDYCNITMEKDESGNYRLPAGVKLFIAGTIKYKVKGEGLASRTMGTVSYTYDTEFPDRINKPLRPYRKVRFV